MKAVGYCRVSTDRQIDSYSLGFQRNEIEKTAKYKGLKVVGYYVDKGISGTSIEARKELKRLLEDAKNHKFEAVIFYDLSRFARNARELLNMYSQLEKQGVHLVSTKESLDTSTPAGKLLRTVLAAVGEFESDVRKEASKLGRIRKAKSGRYPIGQLKYGFKKNGDGRVVVDKEAQKAIRLMVRLILGKGYKLHEVASELNKRGLKPPRAKEWNGSSIYTILVSPALIGQMTWNGIKVPCPSLLTYKEQEDIKRRFKRNLKLSKRRLKSGAEEIWFTGGIIKCKRCGSSLSGESSRRSDGTYYRRYRCNGTRPKGYKTGKNCSLPQIRADDLENAVWKVISGYLDNPEFTKQLKVREKEQLDHNKERMKEINALTEKIRELDETKDRLFKLFRRGKLNPEDIEAQIRDVEKEKSKLQEEQDKLFSNVRETELDIQKMEEIKDLFKNAGPGVQKLICRESVDRIDLDWDDEKNQPVFRLYGKSFLSMFLDSEHNYVMPSRCSYLQCPLSVVLAFHI